MWTTSNSPAERIRGGLRAQRCLGVLAVLSVLGCSQEVEAPDAPRPAAAVEERKVVSEDASAYRDTIELSAVRVRKLDATLERMAGPAFMKSAREPLAIEAETSKALPKTPRSTSAVLFLNGEKLPDTWMILPNKLVAFLPDRGRIRDSNAVAAAWTGAEEISRTKKPLTLRREDFRQ